MHVIEHTTQNSTARCQGSTKKEKAVLFLKREYFCFIAVFLLDFIKCFYTLPKSDTKSLFSMIAQILPKYEVVWQAFVQRQALLPEQVVQFKRYYELLVKTNKIHNLTAIHDLATILSDHFDDSLALRQFLDLTHVNQIADIGTGAGFPAIPLKIIFPHLKLVLIEVNHKKIAFLESLTDALGLTNVTLTDLDWRTFLRQTDFPIDLFCARASLHPEELVRMFKPASPYKEAQLVYWASKHWVPTKKTVSFIEREAAYTIGNKKRRLIFFKA